MIKFIEVIEPNRAVKESHIFWNLCIPFFTKKYRVRKVFWKSECTKILSPFSHSQQASEINSR